LSIKYLSKSTILACLSCYWATTSYKVSSHW
jgi:hypothetical protein